MITNDLNLLKSLIGKTVDSITHDEFGFSNAVYKIMFITIEKSHYAIELIENSEPFLAEKFDHYILTILEKDKIETYIEGNTTTKRINSKITSIKIINDVIEITNSSNERLIDKAPLSISFSLENGLSIIVSQDSIDFESLSIWIKDDPLFGTNHESDFYEDYEDHNPKYHQEIIEIH